jgi:hypothetical protein
MRTWSGVISHVFGLALVSSIGAAAAVACGNGAVGVQACRSIETARCEAAPACPSSLPAGEGIDLSNPIPAGGDPVAACVRYYDDACLHGLETSVAPSNVAVNDCVAAIQAAGAAAAKGNKLACTTVVSPEKNAAACSFLIPVDAGTSAVADAADAGTGSDGATE